MILEVANLLDAAEVAQLRTIAGQAKFVDGRMTNVGNQQKLNLQIDPAYSDYATASRIVMDALLRSREFRDFAFARRIAPPMLTKYEPGMKYGAHADMALLQASSGPMRSDISCTVFLSDPTSYDGGELVIHFGDRPLPIKGRAGAAILYPSTTLHEVVPVRDGQRLVAITFIESYVRGEQERQILFELGEISAIEGARMDPVNRMRLEVVRQNLTRRWAST
jgi:PKHD-type hydroxylase